MKKVIYILVSLILICLIILGIYFVKNNKKVNEIIDNKFDIIINKEDKLKEQINKLNKDINEIKENNSDNLKLYESWLSLNKEISELIDNQNNKEQQDKITLLEQEIKELEQELYNLNNIEEAINNQKLKYYENAKKLEELINNKEVNKKIAYLTFDDGPYYNTYKVLDILEQNNVKATFFTTNINGEKCYDKKSENCKVMYKEYLKYGHTIANHTYTHGIRYGLYSSVDNFMNAVINQEELIKNETDGYITNIVRFPGGSATAGKLKNGIIEKLRERGYGWVDWNSQDGDGGNLKTPEQASNIFYGSINEDLEVILFHDYNDITTSLLPEFINYLRDNNYILLPLFYDSVMINK